MRRRRLFVVLLFAAGCSAWAPDTRADDAVAPSPATAPPAAAAPAAAGSDCTGRYVVRLGAPDKPCGYFPESADLVVERDATGYRVRDRLGDQPLRSDAWTVDARCRLALHADYPRDFAIDVEIGATAEVTYVDQDDAWAPSGWRCASVFIGTVERRPLRPADVTFDEVAAQASFERSWASWRSGSCPRPAALRRPLASGTVVEVEIDARGFGTRLHIDGTTTVDLRDDLSPNLCTLIVHVDNPTGKPQRFRTTRVR